jgi:thiol-disulfide isomerase/thioredoxin
MRRMIAAGPPAKRPPHILLAPRSAPGLARGLASGLASLGTVAVALLLAVMAAFAAGQDEFKAGEFIALASPQPAPAVSFTDTAGNPATFGDFKGKLLLVNLWATWCQPCLREMPSLEKLQASQGDQLTVAAISEDRGGAKVVEPFVAKLGLDTVKVYLDPKSEVGHAFEVRGLPTTVVIDADGRLVGRVEGAAEWDMPKMLMALQPFLPARKEGDPLKRAARQGG